MKERLIKVMQRNQFVYRTYISNQASSRKGVPQIRQIVLLLSIMFLLLLQLFIKSEESFDV